MYVVPTTFTSEINDYYYICHPTSLGLYTMLKVVSFQLFVLFLCRFGGSTHDSVDCWSAHSAPRPPTACDIFKHALHRRMAGCSPNKNPGYAAVPVCPGSPRLHIGCSAVLFQTAGGSTGHLVHCLFVFDVASLRRHFR